jgi:hypothetical protein
MDELGPARCAFPRPMTGFLDREVPRRFTMAFAYYRSRDGRDELVARGGQQFACMRREGTKMVPTPIPSQLREALRPFAPSTY